MAAVIASAIGLTTGPHMPPCVPLPSTCGSGVMRSRSMPMIADTVLMSETGVRPAFLRGPGPDSGCR